MSCGNPHATPCSEVLRDVYLFLDGELGERACHDIRRHLEECGPCLREMGVEREVKALVARSCGGTVAPSHVRDRVMTRLRSVVQPTVVGEGREA